MSFSTIKSNTEISNLFSSGKRFSNRYVTFIIENDTSVINDRSSLQHGHHGRVAFIAGKRNGNAVWRNAAKRRLREIYRAYSDDLAGTNILFIAKSALMNDSYSKVLKTCERTIKQMRNEGPRL